MYKRVKNLKSIFINVRCFVWTRSIVEWLSVIPGIVVYLFVVIRSVGWILMVTESVRMKLYIFLPSDWRFL